MQFFEYFRGIRFKQKHIHIASTGAKIKIDRSFMDGAITILKIYAYFVGRKIKHIATRPNRGKSIAFYPQTPGPWYNIWQVIRLAGLKPNTDYTKADYVFIFEDTTYAEFDAKFADGLNAVLLNHRIRDISKDHVADVFEDVFQYSLSIDPCLYSGPAIQKSNDNGTHDGMVIDCPIAPAQKIPSAAYQRLVDSTFDGQSSEDLRVAYALGEIALVYHKRKPLTDRFGTDYLSVDIKAASDVFSEDEIAQIIAFSEKMGLDFGAIDVMRDKHDGRIYIVDVNKTCMPVLCLGLKTQIKCQQKIADALNRGLNLG